MPRIMIVRMYSVFKDAFSEAQRLNLGSAYVTGTFLECSVEYVDEL